MQSPSSRRQKVCPLSLALASCNKRFFVSFSEVDIDRRLSRSQSTTSIRLLQSLGFNKFVNPVEQRGKCLFVQVLFLKIGHYTPSVVSV
jgi:hypothetical protein